MLILTVRLHNQAENTGRYDTLDHFRVLREIKRWPDASPDKFHCLHSSRKHQRVEQKQLALAVGKGGERKSERAREEGRLGGGGAQKWHARVKIKCSING